MIDKNMQLCEYFYTESVEKAHENKIVEIEIDIFCWCARKEYMSREIVFVCIFWRVSYK